MNSSHLTIVRSNSVMTREPTGQPRTLRIAREVRRQAAYRRLAVAILGLDIVSLSESLRQPAQQAAA